VGRVDPETPRVRHHHPPRPDHQDGMWRPRRRLLFPGVAESVGRLSCR
jgi:hypothetical protein